MDLETAKKAMKSYRTLQAYFETGEFGRTLNTIGDVTTEAAKAMLDGIGSAHDPQRQVAGAVPLLETAHVAREKVWSASTYNSLSDWTDAVRKDAQVLLLLTLAYQYIGERELARANLDELETLERRVIACYLKAVVRHPVHSWKRGMSGYLRPIKSTRGVVAVASLGDTDVSELRTSIEEMELPPALAPAAEA